VVETVASLPPHTVIVYLHILRDGARRAFVPHDALDSLAQVANAPIYGPYETYVGRGIVGGHVYSFEAAAAKIAEVARPRSCRGTLWIAGRHQDTRSVPLPVSGGGPRRYGTLLYAPGLKKCAANAERHIPKKNQSRLKGKPVQLARETIRAYERYLLNPPS
jgi:hypothetical protein